MACIHGIYYVTPRYNRFFPRFANKQATNENDRKEKNPLDFFLKKSIWGWQQSPPPFPAPPKLMFSGLGKLETSLLSLYFQ